MTARTDRNPAGDDAGLDRAVRTLTRGAGEAPAPTLDWARVRADVGLRRRRRLLLTAGAAAVAGALATVLVATLLDGTWSRRAPQAGNAGAPATAREDGYRLYAPSARVRVLVEPGADLRVESPERAALAAGTAWVVVDPGIAPAPFEVSTPDARLVVRGTRFAVRVEPGAGTAVAVYRGRVDVQAPGAAVALAAGGRWASADGVGPAPADDPRRLLPERVARADGAEAGAERAGPAGAGERLPSEPTTAAVAATGPAATAAGPATGPAGGSEEASPGDARPSAGAPATTPSGDARGERARALYQEADRALADGRLEEAVRLLREVVETVPGSSLAGTALMDLGARLVRAGHGPEAEAAYRRYLDEFPQGPFRGEARIALCRLELRDAPERAAACYDAYLAEAPDGPYADEARRYRARQEER